LAYNLFISFGTPPSEVLKYSLQEQVLMIEMLKKHAETQKALEKKLNKK